MRELAPPLHYKNTLLAPQTTFLLQREKFLDLGILSRCNDLASHKTLFFRSGLLLPEHFLRPHLREEEHILDGRLAGHEHRKPVDTHT